MWITNNVIDATLLTVLVINLVCLFASIGIYSYEYYKVIPISSIGFQNVVIYSPWKVILIMLLISSFLLFIIYICSGQNKDYLLLALASSRVNQCQRPSSQSFKCSMYKNGIEITNTSTQPQPL